MRIKTFLCLMLILLPTSKSWGDDMEQRIKALEDASNTQSVTIKKQWDTIDNLKKEIAAEKENRTPGKSFLANPNISMVADTSLYSSSLSDDELGARGIPDFTCAGIEKRSGFNLEAAELFLFAPVDPYFNLYATLPVTEDGAEVEEAYFITTALPEGLQAKGGKFKSGFGRINTQHPHAWDFADAPLAYRAFVGDEGIIEKGVQLTYLPALSFYTQFGIEALQGENGLLFGPDAKSGAHAFSAFAKASFDMGDYSTIMFGPSVVAGTSRNPSISDDTEFRGDSTLYDLEFVYKWKPSKDNSLTVQGEYLLRSQEGELTNTVLSSKDSLKRAQDGVYLQGNYQVGRYRAGARYDRLSFFKNDFRLDGTEQDFGEKPWRATGSIEYSPSEFSRIRVQYNYDKSGRDDRTNHEVLVQFTLGIGAHAAHTF